MKYIEIRMIGHVRRNNYGFSNSKSIREIVLATREYLHSTGECRLAKFTQKQRPIVHVTITGKTCRTAGIIVDYFFASFEWAEFGGSELTKAGASHLYFFRYSRVEEGIVSSDCHFPRKE
jgi:hypothetical protein